jgi:hypothetical protein
VGAGKEGKIYLVNRDNLGHFNSVADSQIVQETSAGTVGGPQVDSPPSHPGARCAPAYWNDQIYYSGAQDVMKSFHMQNGFISPVTPVSQTTVSFGYPGSTPVISANGNAEGIVWTLLTSQYKTGGPAVLYAFDAANLSRELYDSGQAGPRDTAGTAVKFTVPTVANGKVYVGTASELDVYGLLP